MEEQASDRRGFLKIIGTSVPACCLAGLALAQEAPKRKHKWEEQCSMTWEQMYTFAYQGYIGLVTALAKRAGGDKYLDVLKETSGQVVTQVMQNREIEDRSLAAFTKPLKDQDDFWKHVLTLDIVEDSPNAFEVRVKECIWAKTFKQENATEVGYACICHPDFASAKAFNPKMHMERTKTLMQGHDCCNHRWVVEA